MKRALSLVLIAAMMLSCVPAMAAEINTNTSQSGNTVVQYGVDESYIVTVPDSARIDAEGLGNINVSVSNAMLASNATLKVYITGDSYANGYWYLNSRDNATNKLQYTISKNSVELGANGEVLSVDAGQAWNSTVTAELKLRLEGEVSQAGTYSDTLTFVVDYQKTANMQLNEYGFYYEQPYKVDKDGVTLQFVFYEEGYVTGWASGLGEEAGIQPWTMNNGKIETGGIETGGFSFSFAIQNDGMTLFDNTIADDTFTLNLTPVVHANDIDGTFTSQVIGVDVVCDQNNITMYQNGAYIDSLPKSSLTWDKGIIYRNGEPYGFYYPDATMFAMIQAIEDYGASGLLFIKEQRETIPAGAYMFNLNVNVDKYIQVSTALEQQMLECQSNWFSNDAQELCEALVNQYGFDIMPLAIGENRVIDKITVGLSTNEIITDCMDANTAGNIVVRIRNGETTEYMFMSVISLLRFGIATFSIESCTLPKEIAEVFMAEFTRWYNEATPLQYAGYIDTYNEPFFVYFVDGMTWQEWSDNGYTQHVPLGQVITVQDGYVYLSIVQNLESVDVPLYYNGVQVLATDVIQPDGLYDIQ